MQGSAFVANLLLARILGRHNFGEFSIIQSTLLTLAGVGQIATGITAAKFVAENRVVHKRIAGDVIGMCAALTLSTGVLGAALLLIFAPWIAADFLKMAELRSGLTVAAGASLFLTMNGFQLGALAGLESFRKTAAVSIIVGCLHVMACVLGGWAGGTRGALWGLLLSSIARWVCFEKLLHRESLLQGIFVSWSGWRRQKSIFYKFAIPAAVSGFSSMPALWLVTAMLARQPNGYDQLALYSAAYQLKSVAILLPSMFNNVGMALLNHQRGIQNAVGYRRAFWFNVSVGSIAAATFAVVIAIIGKWLLAMYGPAFVGAYGPLLILLCAALFEGVATGAFQAVQSKGRMWRAFWIVAFPRDLLLVACAFVLVGRYGAVGLASSYSVAWIAGSLIAILYAYRTGLAI